jgi:hypothetical protein
MIIALAGKQYAGKDTVGAHLVRTHGFVRVALADPVKEAVERLNPSVRVPPCLQDRFYPTHAPLQEIIDEGERAHMYPAQDIILMREWLKQTIPEITGLWQRMGTEVGRDLMGPTTWLKIAGANVKRHDSLHEDVVITDCRFPNEATYLSTMGAVVWKVKRPDHLRLAGRPVRNTGHASEMNVDMIDPDFTLLNDTDLSELHLNVETVLAASRRMTEARK